VKLGSSFEPVQTRCRRCKSDLVVEDVSDLKMGDFGCARDPGDVDYQIYIVCPACGENIRLPDQEKLTLQYELHQKQKKKGG